MKKKGPKTARGLERKLITGDGRKSVGKHYFGESTATIARALEYRSIVKKRRKR